MDNVSGPYMAIDDRVLAEVNNLKVTLSTPEKCSENPLFTEEYFADPPKLWEARYDNFYPNVHYDPGEGIFKLWYNAFTSDASSEGTPLPHRPETEYKDGHRRTDGLLYAVSNDGIEWTKPELNIVDFEGSTANNIVMNTETHGFHGAGVLFDPDDPDPSRRHKAFFRNSRDRRMAVAFSSDGLHWTPSVNWPEHDAVGDTHNNTIRMSDGKYVGITRGWVGPKNQRVRTVLRTESVDFVHWSEPVEVLRGKNTHDQIYSMPIFRLGVTYFGLPAIFHKGDREAADWDTVDTELAWSTDTITWNRVCPGRPLIPHGEGTYRNGAYDCGCIYAAVPVLVGDTHYIYYGSSNGHHNGFREGSLSLATIQKDRFAGQTASNGIGHCTTKPFVLDGTRIVLNVEIAEGGTVRAEILKTDGAPVGGFSLKDCTPIHDGGMEVSPAWRSDVSTGALRGRNLILHVELQNATVFAISGDIKFL